MKRGEIRRFKFPPPDKKRFVLILTRDSVIDALSEVTVAPVHGTIRDIPSEVLVGPEIGLPHECVINLDHVQTIRRDKIGECIAHLPESMWPDVQAALLFALGF